MRIPYFDYYEPVELGEALGLMAEHRGTMHVLGGGSDLLPRMKLGLVRPSQLMSLRNLANLSSISFKEGALCIGAMTTLAALSASDDIVHSFTAIHEALESVAAPPIRSVATLGGNLCQNSRCLFYNQSETWRKEKPPCLKANGDVCLAVRGGKKCFSVYQGDLAPAIASFGGMIRIEKKGSSRVVPIGELFTGDAKNPIALHDDEILTEVILPTVKGRVGSAYRKLRMRPAMDYPMLSIAAMISLNDAGTVESAAVVTGAAGAAPMIAEQGAELLLGKKREAIDPDEIGRVIGKGAQMIDNLELPGSYRRRMIPVFARRAIEAAVEQAINNAARAKSGKEKA